MTDTPPFAALKTLSALLDGYYYNTLLRIAEFNGLPTTDVNGRKPRKDALIGMLEQRLYVPEQAGLALARLGNLERRVLDRILLHGGELDTDVLRHELETDGLVRPIAASHKLPRLQAGEPVTRQTDGGTPFAPGGEDQTGQYQNSTGTQLEDVLARLTLHGLLLSRGQPLIWNPSQKVDLNPGRQLVVPEPLRAHLPHPELPAIEWGRGSLPAPIAESTTDLAQRDLFIYWSHFRRQPLPLTQLGLVPKRTLRSINEQLLAPDPALADATNEQEAPRLYFLRLLLQALHLLRQERGELHAIGQQSQVPDYWEKTVQQRTDACLQAWQHMPEWSELSSLGMSGFDLDLQRARRLLLKQLRGVEPGVWISTDRFLSRLAITSSHLLFQGFEPPSTGERHSQENQRSAAYSSGASDPIGTTSGNQPWFAPRAGSRGPNAATPPLGLRPEGRTASRHLSGGVGRRGTPGGQYGPLQQGPGRGKRRWLAEVEATFVGGALSGPLHWLGIVDISADGDRVLAFRINTSGVLVLGTDSQTTVDTAQGIEPSERLPSRLGSEDETKLIVQPNFEVLALGPVPEATLARMELFADRVKADRSAFEYVLSRKTIYRGQKAGLSADQIITFLEQAAGATLPQNVRRSLQEWGEQHERIVFHRAVTLCHAADADLMERLSNEAPARAYLEQRLAPTIAVVTRGRASALREALLRQDILPALSTRSERCTGRLQATADGELRPLYEGPDLILETCLDKLAEQRQGRFWVTRQTVSRALATGMSVPQYLDRLTALHRGPLPAALQAHIKAWGHYYGKASLQEAVLLEVKDSATADELLADAELGPLLARFPGDPHGRVLLARRGTQDSKRLQQLLEERGIELVDKV